MRRLWAFLLGGLTFVGTAEARLGETKLEAESRYGKPVEAEPSGSFECFAYRKDGYILMIYFLENKAEILIIQKEQEALTESEVSVVLEKNSAGSGFLKTKFIQSRNAQMYEEKDSGRAAFWSLLKGELIVRTKVGIETAEKDALEKSKKGLEKF